MSGLLVALRDTTTGDLLRTIHVDTEANAKPFVAAWSGRPAVVAGRHKVTVEELPKADVHCPHCGRPLAGLLDQCPNLDCLRADLDAEQLVDSAGEW